MTGGGGGTEEEELAEASLSAAEKNPVKSTKMSDT